MQKIQEDDVSIITNTTETDSGQTNIKTQDELKQHIREILHIESEMILLRKRKAELDKKKKEISENLMALMKEREIDSFDTKQNKIVFKKTKTQTMNKNVLYRVVEDYYKGNQEAANDLHSYIYDNLPVRMRETIVIVPTKAK